MAVLYKNFYFYINITACVLVTESYRQATSTTKI